MRWVGDILMINIEIFNRKLNKTIYVPYLDGVVITKTFNEQLDNGTIIIPNVDELDINQLDFITIISEDKTKRLTRCINTITKEWSSSDNFHKYDYTITFSSLTLLLQDKILPNITITQPLIGTKYTILDEVKRILDVYLPNHSISNFLKKRIEDVICPEFQWNRKTIYEVLSDMLAVVNVILNVPYFQIDENNNIILVISCIPLDFEREEIDHNKIVEITEEKPIDEYCTELEMSAEHVIASKTNSMFARNITPRSSDYVLTTENCQLI